MISLRFTSLLVACMMTMSVLVQGFVVTTTPSLLQRNDDLIELDFQPKTSSSSSSSESGNSSNGGNNEESQQKKSPSYKITKLQHSSIVEGHDDKAKHRSIRQNLQGMALNVLLYSYEVDRKEFGPEM